MKSLARGQLVFVYGTLRRDSEHPLAQRLAATSEYLGEATIPGKLYWTADDFPALIAGEGPDRVVGDLYQVGEASLLDVLDLYEGHFYERRRLPVSSSVTGLAAAWVYLYVGAVDPARLIEHGDYTAAWRARQKLNASAAVAGSQIDHS